MNLALFAIIVNMVIGVINISIGLITLSIRKTDSMIFSMLCSICNFLIALIIAVISKKNNN